MLGGDPFYLALVGLVILLTVNRLALPRLVRVAWLFWTLLAIDAAVAIAVVWRGFPGIEHVGAARWILAALLGVHIAQALSARDRAKWEDEKRSGRPPFLPPVRGEGPPPDAGES